ncbi:unnamed protein product [Sphagnum compactum]
MSASELENAVRKIEGFGEEEYRCKIEEIHSVFTEDALHDHLILRIRLYELLENTSLSPDQQEKVTNLLKLLATHPADMREQKIQKIDLLLAIEPEKLAHISRIGKGAYGVVSKVPVALDIMLQIAEAMQYLHRKSIVRRDFKLDCRGEVDGHSYGGTGSELYPYLLTCYGAAKLPNMGAIEVALTTPSLANDFE